jgi:hypothetical protein
MRRAWHAAAAYLALAIVATWPLVRGLGRDVPADLGDPVFVMWVLAWDCQQLLAILSGDFARVATFFDANIFHPASLTLAYSEHFIAQAVQVLPIWAVTGNPILCYNLLYLSTFVLSGLGAYLCVRELTGDPRAAFVAGVLFAFAPYRFPQSSHLQVLSSQWMPFALYGFRRYFDAMDAGAPRGGGWRPLTGAVAALIAQNLSCTYYLMFFSPFVAAYVLWEIWRRSLWSRRRLWLHLAAGAAIVTAVTVPLLLPYVAVQDQLQIARSRGELSMYAADVYSFATAVREQILWGTTARLYPKAEGDLFPGLVAVFFAVLGIVVWRRDPEASTAPRVTRLAWVLVALSALHLVVAVATLLYRRFTVDLGVFTIRVTNIDQLLLRAIVILTIAAVLSPGLRSLIVLFMRTRGFFVVALLAAMWLSLGLSPQTLGRPLNFTGLYSLLYSYVPGFDGLRVPARFNMISVLMLAVLGGYGAALVSRWRWATPALALLTTAFFAESLVRPFPINGMGTLRDYTTPQPRVYRPARAPAVYQRLARETDVVLAELPLGQPDYDTRAMFYSIRHHGRLLNGYSGFFPPHYGLLALTLSDIPAHAMSAWDTLRRFDTSHVLVHEGAWLDDRGTRTTAALTALGATEIFRDGGDVLLRLPSTP